MADVLADRCSTLMGPVMQLMNAIIRTMTDKSQGLVAARLAGDIKAVVELGSVGIQSAAYDRWLSTAPETLSRIEEAGGRGHYGDMWAAFTDPEKGMYLLGKACEGTPGWSAPGA